MNDMAKHTKKSLLSKLKKVLKKNYYDARWFYLIRTQGNVDVIKMAKVKSVRHLSNKIELDRNQSKVGAQSLTKKEFNISLYGLNNLLCFQVLKYLRKYFTLRSN